MSASQITIDSFSTSNAVEDKKNCIGERKKRQLMKCLALRERGVALGNAYFTEYPALPFKISWENIVK